MLNVHLSYKPSSSWRILFRSEGYSRQFSRLKKFRALVVPVGGFCKGIIIHERQLKRRLFCGRPVMPENKIGCNGRFFLCTKIGEFYIHTDIYMVYLRDQTTRTPSLANTPIQTTSPGTLFTSPLHPLFLVPGVNANKWIRTGFSYP